MSIFISLAFELPNINIFPFWGNNDFLIPAFSFAFYFFFLCVMIYLTWLVFVAVTHFFVDYSSVDIMYSLFKILPFSSNNVRWLYSCFCVVYKRFCLWILPEFDFLD